jgi:hypothetical protein
VALSTAKAEYITTGACCAQILYMKQTLLDYGVVLDKVPITPLSVKHALTFQSMSISISYMFIITCNINSLELECGKHWFKPNWLHLLAKV